MKFASLEKHIPVSERGRRTRPTTTANTPAGTHGRARVPSVTPDERPKQTNNNPYSPLQADTDDDESNRSNNDNTNNSGLSVTSDDDDSYYNIPESITMVPELPLYDRLSEKLRKVNPEPNLIDIQTLRSNLANILFEEPSDKMDTGHASIIETLAGHQRRMNDATAVLPSPPTKPTEPLATDSKQHWRVYDMRKENYKQYKKWDKQVINIIKTVFPNGLTDKEIDTSGMYPMTLTGRESFDHIESKAKTDIIATETYCKILKQMMAREYEPNSNGPTQYLKEMKHDQYCASTLAEDGEINDGQLIAFSKQAFLSSGHKPEGVTVLNEKWANLIIVGKAKDPNWKKAMFLEFSDLYIAGLKALFDGGDTGPKQQAHHTELLGRINNIESQQEQTNTNIDQLYDNQESIAAKQDGASIPGAISTSGETAFSAAESQAKMIKEAVASALGTALANTDLTQGATRNKAKEVTEFKWMQWKYWCWTCGVNLTHNTARHKGNKQAAHQNHLTATKDNPQGGGIAARDVLWMKWCHPINRKVYDKRGE